MSRRYVRVRKTLLKGLYDENLRIVGKLSYRRARKSYLTKGRLVFFSMAAVLLFLGYMDYSDPDISAQKAPRAALAKPAEHPVDVVPAEYTALLNNGGMPIKMMFGLEVKTIIIDAGHGGDDPGAMGKAGTMEKEITLDVAKRLKERLLSHNSYKVLMTRDSDLTLSLKRRTEIANENKGDLFISIHVNSLPKGPIDIIETFYFGPSSDTITLELAAKENAGSKYSLSDYNAVIQEIGNTLKFQESKVLAAHIQKDLYLNMKNRNKDVLDFGVKRAPFLVLIGAEMPAVLAEVACISSMEEEAKLRSPAYRDDIARYLEIGIIKYLNARSAS